MVYFSSKNRRARNLFFVEGERRACDIFFAEGDVWCVICFSSRAPEYVMLFFVAGSEGT